MLLIARMPPGTSAEQVQPALPLADAVVVAEEATAEATASVVHLLPNEAIPIGIWATSEAASSVDDSDRSIDFVITEMEGPSALLSRDSWGKFVVVEAGLEAGRLRAIADLGVDAFVMKSSDVDPKRLSGAVSCRRVHSLTGTPVVLLVDEAIQTDQVTSLWRAGVDALMVDVSHGEAVFGAVHEAICNASYDARMADRGRVVSIGRMSVVENGRVDDEEGDGEDDDYE